MRPQIADTVPAQAWEVLARARSIIEALPELIEFPAFICGVRVGSDIAVSHGIPSCHVIAHSLAAFLHVNVHDGFVLVIGPSGEQRNLEHSWLTLRDGDPSVIIDPWPLGVVTGPAIFLQNYAYHFGPECCFLNHRGEQFTSQVEAVVTAISSILET